MQDTTSPLPAYPTLVSALADSVGDYQIFVAGAAWSSVRRCALSDEIARVERTLRAERERVSGVDRRFGWIERSYEFGTSSVCVEVTRWDYSTCRSIAVARWRRGERCSLAEVE